MSVCYPILFPLYPLLQDKPCRSPFYDRACEEQESEKHRQEQQQKQERIEHFLNELTELSRKYRLAIGGAPIICELERDDLDRRYIVGDRNRLCCVSAHYDPRQAQRRWCSKLPGTKEEEENLP